MPLIYQPQGLRGNCLPLVAGFQIPATTLARLIEHMHMNLSGALSLESNTMIAIRAVAMSKTVNRKVSKFEQRQQLVHAQTKAVGGKLSDGNEQFWRQIVSK